jgi:2,4-dienoyl-CoA reductase-like NADH-dependent reductase (Old Yellow Enzyme family)
MPGGASNGRMAARTLFDPYQLGPLTLKNRIVMAPLTRSRAGEGDAPGELNAQYYEQRACAGLIISEATQVSRQGQGYLWTPGIYSPEQVEGWKTVVNAVHGRGGRMFLQMWHVGRISHVTLQPNGKSPISSTDKPADKTFSFAYDADGNPANVPASQPRIATIAELKQVVADYSQGARNAKEAGFDGVEVHGANGYLFDQFLNSAVNERHDEYGNQSKETRTRLLLEAFDAVAAVFGPDRVGVRIAPFGNFGGMKADPNAEETFLHLAQELTRRKAVYVHIVLGSQNDPEPVVPEAFLRKFRNAFGGTIIVTGGLNKAKAEKLLQEDIADLFGFGMLFISNPDLVARFKHDWPLATADTSTLYGGSAKGYTDYPMHQEECMHREVKEPLDIH